MPLLAGCSPPDRSPPSPLGKSRINGVMLSNTRSSEFARDDRRQAPASRGYEWVFIIRLVSSASSVPAFVLCTSIIILCGAAGVETLTYLLSRRDNHSARFIQLLGAFHCHCRTQLTGLCAPDSSHSAIRDRNSPSTHEYFYHSIPLSNFRTSTDTRNSNSASLIRQSIHVIQQ